MDPQVAQWRQETPGCANRAHLNNAGAGLMPRSVLDAIVGHLNREANFGGYESADDASAAVGEAYTNVARLIGAQPRNIAVVENSTVAFFQALAAFDFRPGDVIVTTRNDYISNQLAYLSLVRRCGVEVRRAADLASGGVDPQSVRELLRDPRVRLLAATWVPTNSGLIQPVEALGEIAGSAEVPYIIDACQAVGEISVDIARLRCDFLSATARKFLRGPRGLGFLYVSDRALKRGDFPLYIDMRGADWVSADSFEPAQDARRFENWEFPYSLVLGLGEAARYAMSVGIECGGRRARELAASLRRKLSDVSGFRVLDRGTELAAIVTVEIKDRNAVDVVKLLRRRGINTSATRRAVAVIDMDEKRATSAVRLSPHYYNTEEEIDRAVEALKSLLAKPSGL
ncbi:MAG TPA: aminotransferase class V-fold PLP-dependent enzyme [Candidatus Acidoferrales bacterium]|nr:aminotransferase class V-fold PLP-dependent enzyme [Candidatus Acidoferrales bacterium]